MADTAGYPPDKDLDVLRQAITVRQHDADGPIRTCAGIYTQRIDDWLADPESEPERHINLAGDEHPIRWALRPTLELLSDSLLSTPHQVSLVVRGYGSSGSISRRHQRAHYDSWVQHVSSILLTGTDEFRLWASPEGLSPRRRLLQTIDRQPGTEVLIDQTATIEATGETWRVEHEVSGASERRIALVLRTIGPGAPPPTERDGFGGAISTRSYRSWPGGGVWWNVRVLGGEISEPIGPSSDLEGALEACEGDYAAAEAMCRKAEAWNEWKGTPRQWTVTTRSGSEQTVTITVFEPDWDDPDNEPRPPPFADGLEVEFT